MATWNAAITAAERGVRACEPLFNTVWLACDPMFASLWSRPKFVALVRELGGTVCTPDRPWPVKPRR